MKPIHEVWLEIAKQCLISGDSAVIACSKASVVTSAYIDRFNIKEGIGLGMIPTPEQAKVWLEKLKKEHEATTVGDFVSGESSVK